MPVDPKRVQSLFLEVLAVSEGERNEALQGRCGGDVELRQRVEALLFAHDHPDSILKQPAAVLQPTVLTGSEPDEPDNSKEIHSASDRRRDRQSYVGPTQSPDRVDSGRVIAGRYTLQEKIGEGGMGEVWVARQSEPVKRRVALKLVKSGMDSTAILQRFEQERQALAIMDHPNIAQVLDGGLTSSGHPFFVMELVNGLSLTAFCDKAKLTPRERLELFLPICHAVQHAHQKGIVHRDLKPANILVTLIDGKPVPKVIDFGVAKATSGKLTEETLSTQFGAVVGTLEYMAPEQAGFSGEDIDTRADIYSLGVVLYEVLTGLRPIDAKRLKKVALNEMIRIVREEDPSKPSTRLSTDDSLPSLAAIRRTEPKKLMALLRGELDWIVMKCLEKQRDRRYETANALARDIERHLNDEPVEAHAPSTAYRLKKFTRKHKAAIVTSSLVAMSLFLGLAGSIWQTVRATRAESIATDLYRKEQQARSEAQEAREAEHTQRLLATTAERLAERREYDANALLLQKNWEQSNLEDFHRLLNALKPRSGEEDLRGFEWYFWRNSASRGFSEVVDGFAVSTVAFSPDGKFFAGGSGEGRSPGEVRIWNTATQQLVRELPAHEYRVHDVAFSSDGRFLATGCGEHSKGGWAKVWDLTNGDLIFQKQFKNTVKSVAFSPDPDAAKLVAGSSVLFGKWGELKVWDWRTGEEQFSVESEDKGYRGVTFTPDGKSIAAGSRENDVPGSQIEIWNLETKEVKVLPAHADFVFAISIRQANEDSELDFRIAAAVGSWNGPPGVVKQWDENGQQLPVQLVGHEGRVWDVCFSHDGRKIATSCFDNSIKIWDADSGIELVTLRGHKSYALSAAFSPDDKHVLSGSDDNSMRIWDAVSGQGTLTTEKQSKELHHVDYNRDGTRLASAGHDGTARVWDAKTGLEIMSFDHGAGSEDRTNDVYCVAFSPDDRLLATASGIATSFGFGDLPPVPGDIKVWDLKNQRLVHHFRGHTAKGCAVAFSPDGRTLASASGGWGESGEIKLWDLETGNELDAGLQGSTGIVGAVAFSPDGKHLVWSRFDYPPEVIDRTTANKAQKEGRTKSVVIYWNLEKRQTDFEFLSHSAGVINVAFRPGGGQLATAGADGKIKLWDLLTGREIQTLEGHSHRVHSVDYSPDGTRVVSGSPDGTARLWDLETGRELLTFKEHSGFVWGVAFSPDGEHIASTGSDGTVKIWDGSRDALPVD